MEFWPLIRVVRIYVKSPALATGAVIADLPGVHDAKYVFPALSYYAHLPVQCLASHFILERWR